MHRLNRDSWVTVDGFMLDVNFIPSLLAVHFVRDVWSHWSFATAVERQHLHAQL